MEDNKLKPGKQVDKQSIAGWLEGGFVFDSGDVVQLCTRGEIELEPYLIIIIKMKVICTV